MKQRKRKQKQPKVYNLKTLLRSFIAHIAYLFATIEIFWGAAGDISILWDIGAIILIIIVVSFIVSLIKHIIHFCIYGTAVLFLTKKKENNLNNNNYFTNSSNNSQEEIENYWETH